MSRYRWALSHPGISRIRHEIAPVRAQVTAHPLYRRLDDADAIARFTTHHVYAVWDFMSLLKSLQSELTCVSVPWRPTGSPTARRLINDIVLAEESDEIDGEFISHFELYRRGMTGLGADTAPLDDFLHRIEAGAHPVAALTAAGAPATAAEFVGETFDMIATLPVHARAAVFAFGREDLIPPMFAEVLAAEADPRSAVFRTYLARHIQVDEEEHAPMAMQMIADLCGDHDTAWRECATAARRALQARLRFWDGVLAALPETALV
ncbi:DUF3050 domain-containing protein [Catenuloplanes japonicus]|uniref:DUF3050 domain-containing protein n=1 Tax=Catenuloplanes japonicus TaxID=33876 RepID=UPI00052781F0|nr:DUF3050 domain-containing protein [Catenuloplanes japonicus]